MVATAPENGPDESLIWSRVDADEARVLRATRREKA